MEIKQLRYFLAVTELGSFSRAAVALSVAQPVLSRQLRSLEEELEIELLYRNGRGVLVTEAGQFLVEHARTIVDTAGLIVTEMGSMRAEPAGRLVIGMPPTASTVLTVPLVQRFRNTFPKVKLKVDVGYSGHVLEWLSMGRIDVAILYDAPKTSTLTTQPLIEEDLLLIGPATPDYPAHVPIAARELGSLPMILPSHPHGLRVLVETLLESVQVVPDVVFEVDNLHASLELVQGGLGYTILPYASVVSKVKSNELVATPIIEPRMSRQLVLATSTKRPVTLVTRALVGTVVQLVRDLVKDGLWVQDVTKTGRDKSPTL